MNTYTKLNRNPNLIQKLIILKDLGLTLSNAGTKYNFDNKNIEGIDSRTINGKLYVHIRLKGRQPIDVPLRRYNLNKKCMATLGLVSVLTTSAIAGSIAGFKYTKDKNDNLEITEATINTTAEEIFYEEEKVEETINTYPTSDVAKAEVTYTEPEEISLAEAMEVSTPTEETTTYEVEAQPVYSDIRMLSVEGDSTRGIDAYNRIINNYYDDILEFATTYGIDPSIIAAMMMEEGGTDYNPNETEDMSAIGFGQVNANIWNNYTFHPYNFKTNEYEEYTLDVSNIMNNPREQIEVLTYMVQEAAINYNGNFSAITVCYNQGCGTVVNIANSLVNSGDYDSRSDVYNSADALAIYENDYYTYGNKDYTNRIVTYMDEILDNQVFGSSVASIYLPDGTVINYQTEVTNSLSR